MRCRKGHRDPKRLPYGSQRGRYWCWGCDAELVPPKANKKRARRKAKKDIQKQLNE